MYKVTTETMGPMHGEHYRWEVYGSDIHIHPCVGETSLKALQSCLGL